MLVQVVLERVITKLVIMPMRGNKVLHLLLAMIISIETRFKEAYLNIN